MNLKQENKKIDPEYCHIINDGALNPFVVRTNPARVRPEREPEVMPPITVKVN